MWHAWQVYKLKQPLELPLHDWKTMQQMLRAGESAKIGKNDWKERTWTLREQRGLEAHRAASRMYYRSEKRLFVFHSSPQSLSDCKLSVGHACMRAG